MRAVLRRRHGAIRRDTSELHVGDIFLDLESHQARYQAKSAQLTPLEFRVLSLLMMNPGRVVPLLRLVQYAWGYDTIDTQVRNARQPHPSQARLPTDGPGAIRSVSSVGYTVLVAPAHVAAAHEDADQRRTQSQVSLRLLSSNSSADGTASV